jgi:hypothetical protein
LTKGYEVTNRLRIAVVGGSDDVDAREGTGGIDRSLFGSNRGPTASAAPSASSAA